MDSSKRTKEALLARTLALTNAIAPDPDDVDPWGSDGYLSVILKLVQLQDTSDYSAVPQFEPALDYATSAGREYAIGEGVRGVIKTAQDISVLIRDLQELWLFGGLDTLVDGNDDEKAKKKAETAAKRLETMMDEELIGSAELESTKDSEQNGQNKDRIDGKAGA